MNYKQNNNQNFHKYLKVLLKHEGTEFVNHSHDPGGATRYGITIAAARRYIDPNYTITQLKNISMEDVKSFYFIHYWDKPSINKLPPYLASLIFDCSVNHGQKQAIKFLQRSIGTKVDGIIGPKTIKSATEADPLFTCKEIAARRATFYGKLSTFKYFGLGWSRRNIEQLIISLNIKY